MCACMHVVVCFQIAMHTSLGFLAVSKVGDLVPVVAHYKLNKWKKYIISTNHATANHFYHIKVKNGHKEQDNHTQ